MSAASLIAPGLVPTVGVRGLKLPAWRRAIGVDSAVGVTPDSTAQPCTLGVMLTRGPPHAAMHVRQLFEHSGWYGVLGLAGIGLTPIKLDAKMCTASPATHAWIGHELMSAHHSE